MGPLRTCVGCRGTFDKNTLVRYALAEGRLAVDAKGTLPGRGAYTCRQRKCVQDACSKKDVFSRALKQKVIVPGADELWGSITREITAQIKYNGSPGN